MHHNRSIHQIFLLYSTFTPTINIYTLSLHDALPILENVALAPMKVRHKSRAEAEAKSMELLTRVGIPEQAKKYPGQLSEIGRAQSELQSPCNLVCRLLLEKKNK